MNKCYKPRIQFSFIQLHLVELDVEDNTGFQLQNLNILYFKKKKQTFKDGNYSQQVKRMKESLRYLYQNSIIYNWISNSFEI